MEWQKLLAEELADATKLVWLAQNSIAENSTAREVCHYVEQLRYRVGVLTGLASRAVLWEEQNATQTAPPSVPAADA